MKQSFSRLWVPVSWTTIIFILLSLPGSMLPSEQGFEIPYFDKLVHLILFGVFVVLWCFYYNGKEQVLTRKWSVFTIVFLTGIAYGTAMEYLQKYVIPNRDFEIGDIAADAAGAAIGYIICLVGLTRKR